MNKIDTKAIEEHIRGILTALGDDPDREGLKETPHRVAMMYSEVFEGMNYTNEEIAEMFSKSFEVQSDSEDFVLVKDIEAFSYCEHHIALMYDMKISVAYIPRGRVLGHCRDNGACRGKPRRCRYHRGVPQLYDRKGNKEALRQDLHNDPQRTL